MAIHTNLWSPDHCQCQIEFEFDDELPAEKRVHTARRIVKKCPAHSTSDIMDRHDHYETVLKENQTKNKVYGHFMETFPEHTEEVSTEDTETHVMLSDVNELKRKLITTPPEPSKKLKKGIKYLYTFDGVGKNRTLHVAFDGADIPDNKKKQWEKQLHSHVGHDKVVVV